MLMNAFQNQGSNLKRWLGLFLLIFIVYGTTVEAAHRHGRVVPATHNATAFEHTGTSSTSPTSQSGCSDCLICQLHQNFSASLISVKPFAELLVSQTYTPQSDPVSIRSITHSPNSGRAPPQAN
jgi:Protein of unknown function (DUF2946)